MTNIPPAASPNTSLPEVLRRLLDHLLPLLLLSSLSVKSFLTFWRQINSKLTQLQTLLTHASNSQNWQSNSLFLDLIPQIVSNLDSLSSLASRCLTDLNLISGKLLLQSDLNISSSLLSSHIHDLDILVKSGLLINKPNTCAVANAIVLCLPGKNAKKDEYVCFVRDCFARIKIGGAEMKRNALESLIELVGLDLVKVCAMVAQEGDVGALVRLLDPMDHCSVRDQAVRLVEVLCCGSDVSRKVVFEEGGLGLLIRLLETGSVSVKEHAVKAIEAITLDRNNVWAISAYGGVGVLIYACKCGGGSPAVNALAVGALKNVAVVDDLRIAMVEEGALVVLGDLIDSGSHLAQKNAWICLCLLAGDEHIRVLIFQEKGLLERLMQLVIESSDFEIIEHGLRAIQALSLYIPANRFLSSSHKLFAHLAEMIKIGNILVQQISVSLISLSSLNDEFKRMMGVCMPSIIKMMELPKPVNAQEIASKALVSLLSVRSNRIELGRDVKSMMKLVLMLDLKREEICKKYPVMVLITLGVSGGCRKRLNELGVCEKLQKLVDADVDGAKRALKVISGSKLKNIFSLSWRE